MVGLEVPIAPTSVVTMVGALEDNFTTAKLAVECDCFIAIISLQAEKRHQLIKGGNFLRGGECDVVIDQAAVPEAAHRASPDRTEVPSPSAK